MKVSKWNDYISGLEGRTPARGMSAFRARFIFAASMESIQAPGVATNSLATYSSLCRLGLSYSALDHLETILGITDHPMIKAHDLAQKVRTTRPTGFEIITTKMKVHGMLLSKLELLFKDHSQGKC